MIEVSFRFTTEVHAVKKRAGWLVGRALGKNAENWPLCCRGR